MAPKSTWAAKPTANAGVTRVRRSWACSQPAAVATAPVSRASVATSQVSPASTDHVANDDGGLARAHHTKGTASTATPPR